MRDTEVGLRRRVPVFFADAILEDGEVVSGLREGGAAADGAAAGTGGFKLGGEGSAGAGFVGEEQPGFFARTIQSRLRFRSFSCGAVCCQEAAGFAGEEGDLSFAAVGNVETTDGSGFREAGLCQGGFPLGAWHQGLVGTQVAVGEVPPAAGQAEDGFCPKLRRGDIDEE